jgi:hypothetical protein
MPEITTITSESLQAEVRRLLPSQRGFGQDLEAQNVIVPIVDLTPTAEGSALREDLQTAASHGGMTVGEAQNQTDVVWLNTPGFYKYTATICVGSGVTGISGLIDVYDGSTQKILHELVYSFDANPEEPVAGVFEGIIYLNTGDSARLTSTGSDALVRTAGWQIADVNGNLVNPSGFSFE